MRELVIGGKYKHFKGNEYRVIDIAKHSESQEEMVIYKQLYGNGDLWVRPKDMFLESVTRDENTFNRFEYVEE